MLLKINYNCNDEMLSSFLLFVSTTTTAKDDHNGFCHATHPKITTTKKIFNYQTDVIDNDNDDSSSNNNDCFQFVSHDVLALFDNVVTIPNIRRLRNACWCFVQRQRKNQKRKQ